MVFLYPLILPEHAVYLEKIFLDQVNLSLISLTESIVDTDIHNYDH
jgi:hypothetical protein